MYQWSIILLLLVIYCYTAEQFDKFVIDDYDDDNDIEQLLTNGAYNVSQYSSMYHVKLGIRNTNIYDSKYDLQKKLAKMVEIAILTAEYKRRGQIPPKFDIHAESTKFNVTVINSETTSDTIFITFVAFTNSQPISGDSVASDLKATSINLLSVILQHPIQTILSRSEIEAENTTKWWIIALILCTGIILTVFGWIVLFIYYNTCGNIHQTLPGDYMTKAQREKLQKGIIVSPVPSWAQSMYETPSEKTNDGNQSIKPKLKEKYSRSFRTLSEATLEKSLNESNKRKPIEICDKGSDNHGEMSKGISVEKKARHPKIGPVTLSTDSSDVSSFQSEGNSENNRKIMKDEQPKKIEAIGNADRWNSIDERSSDNNNNNCEAELSSDKETMTTTTINAIVRPKAAGKTRTKLFERDYMCNKPSRDATNITALNLPKLPNVWNPSINGSLPHFWTNNEFDYPQPNSPTENGIVEISGTGI